MKSWKTTASAIVVILLAVFTAVGAMVDSDPETAPDWNIVAAEIMAGVGLFMARDNDKTSAEAGATPKARRPKHDLSKLPCLVPFLLVAIVAGGCVTTRFAETVTDDVGDVVTTEYEATSAAWPFSKIDLTQHKMDYRWGGNENEILVGQDATGIDNTGMSVLVPMLETLIQGIADAYAAANAPPMPQPVDINVTP